MRSPIEETEGAIERLGTFYGGVGVVEEHEMRMRAREVAALEELARVGAVQAAIAERQVEATERIEVKLAELALMYGMKG